MRYRILLTGVGLLSLAQAAQAQDNMNSIDGRGASEQTAPTPAAPAAPDEAAPVAAVPAETAPIIVTAQRREQRLQDVPLTIAARSGEQLEAAGVNSITDIQNVVSGVSFGGQGTAMQPSIRGVNTLVSTGGSENPVALYIDGIYYSTPQILASYLPDVERLEVLKGPQGTLFGRNSVAGAIRLFTKDPQFTPAADFSLEAGYFTGGNGSRSSPRIGARGFVTAPIVDDVAAVSLSAGYEWVDGFLTDVATGSDYGVLRRENVRAKLLLTPTDDLKIVLGGFYLNHDDTGANASSAIDGLNVAAEYPGSIIADEPYESAYNLRPDGPQNVAGVETYALTANIEWGLDGLGTLSSLTGWNDNDVLNLVTLNHARTADQCLIDFVCTDYDYTYRTKAFSQELNFVSDPFGIAQVSTGLYYYRNRSRTTAAIQSITPGGDVVQGGFPIKEEIFRIDAYAAYAEVELKPTDRLTLILGGRYTHEVRDDTGIAGGVTTDKKVTFDSFIPRVTAKYDVTPQLNVYATYSRGEKSGLSGISNTASTPPLEPVDSEENTAYEVGLKYADSLFSLNVAGFYYDYKNKQEQGFTGSAVFLQNSGPVEIYGIDADASVNLSSNFTLRANGSWLPKADYKDFENAAAYSTARNPNGTFQQVSFDATGDRIPRAPKFTGNLGLDYIGDMGSGELDASINLAYSSSLTHDLFGVVRQPSYITLNARTGYTFDNMRIGIYGRNLTNEAYINNTAASSLGFFANYSRPLELGVSLSASY